MSEEIVLVYQGKTMKVPAGTTVDQCRSALAGIYPETRDAEFEPIENGYNVRVKADEKG